MKARCGSLVWIRKVLVGRAQGERALQLAGVHAEQERRGERGDGRSECGSSKVAPGPAGQRGRGEHDVVTLWDGALQPAQ